MLFYPIWWRLRTNKFINIYTSTYPIHPSSYVWMLDYKAFVLLYKQFQFKEFPFASTTIHDPLSGIVMGTVLTKEILSWYATDAYLYCAHIYKPVSFAFPMWHCANRTNTIHPKPPEHICTFWCYYGLA